jgi:Flp pilus assembly protein TadD
MNKVAITIGATLLALSLGLSAPSFAFDTGGTDIPTMAEARADIKAEHWQSAIEKLKLIVADNGSADAYNLLGYSYRNLGDFKRAGQFYSRALKLDPNHTGALEYQGILFVKTGELDAAKANLAKLKTICGVSCEEYEDLAEAING